MTSVNERIDTVRLLFDLGKLEIFFHFWLDFLLLENVGKNWSRPLLQPGADMFQLSETCWLVTSDIMAAGQINYK